MIAPATSYLYAPRLLLNGDKVLHLCSTGPTRPISHTYPPSIYSTFSPPMPLYLFSCAKVLPNYSCICSKAHNSSKIRYIQIWCKIADAMLAPQCMAVGSLKKECTLCICITASFLGSKRPKASHTWAQTIGIACVLCGDKYEEEKV